MSSKSDETRIRILQAAWKQLEAGGAGIVRMSDIAKQAGISRQAVYLHFETRAELLIATTRFIDDKKNLDARLAASREAASGVERLDAFVEAWCSYVPEIYGVGKALMAMQDTDEAAAKAWDDRMQAVRHGCAAAIKQLAADGTLTAAYSAKQATDLLWTLLSVRNWEQLTSECGWSQSAYVKHVKALARQTLVARAT